MSVFVSITYNNWLSLSKSEWIQNLIYLRISSFMYFFNIKMLHKQVYIYHGLHSVLFYMLLLKSLDVHLWCKVLWFYKS